MKESTQPAKQPQQQASSDTTASTADSSASPAVRPLLQLQRAIGNQAVRQLLGANTRGGQGSPDPATRARAVPGFGGVPASPRAPAALQTRLVVNAPGDVREREADHAADRVMRMSQPHPQRKCACGGDCPACRTAQPHAEHAYVQTKHAGSGGSGATTAPPVVHQALRSAGQRLDASTREFMEGRFGHDFGQVRIHTGPSASAAAQGVTAEAFTVGEHIVFGDGRYAPAHAAGRHLLAHELAHVLQQRTGAPAVQRRAAHCPASPPSPPVVKTMDDFIALVKRVEASTSTGSDPIATARLISRTKYDGRAWDWLLPSTKGQAGATAGGTVTTDDIGSLCFKLIVTMPGGGQEDPMHLIAAIVADAETQAAGTGATGISKLARPLPASVSQRGASTWVGDVGKAAAHWMAGYPAAKGGTTMADYMREDAPPHDLMADVDGVALTSKSAASGFAFDRAKPLSENLQRFFAPASRTGRERRFHVFCSAEGLALEADGVTLSTAAQDTIRARVKDFAVWFQSTDPTLFKFAWARADDNSYTWLLMKREKDWRWFADQFISFVQTNLTAEGP